MWIDHELVEIEELSGTDRALVAAQWAPTARLILKRSWLTPGGEVDGLEWIRKVAHQLGLDIDLTSGEAPNVPDTDIVIALAGPTLDDVVRGPVTNGVAGLLLLPLRMSSPPTRAPLRLATSQWRHNERSPVGSLLLASDGEFWQHHRVATEAGYDGALVLNLKDQPARVGRGALFVLTGGVLTTPPLSEGAPDTPWRDLVARRLDAIERPLAQRDLAAALGVAVLSEAGWVSAVEQIDDLELSLAGDLVAGIRAALT